ncbi:hypothetical protein JL720_14513 [Aureococcus anophagefferens]|nr:hypothetical protein JL720_14513 [Aureococcus anophagefferens]
MGDAGREGARSSSTESRRSKKNSHVAIEMAKTTSERLLKLSPSSSRAKGRRGLFSGPRTRFLSPGEPGQYAGGGNFGVGIREQNPMRSSWRVFVHDPYHSIVRLPFCAIIGLFMVFYVGGWLLFTPAYMAISERLITMSTIGFGTPDMTFNGCTQAIFLIMAQTLVGTLMNAALVGLIYTKVARSKRRAVRIVFSKQAVVRRIRGNLYFMFQLFDRSSSSTNDQLIEAHVRCYCIRHVTGDDDVPVFFQQCAMRLSHPNDENGGMLMMALPTLVTHRIDPWSPLCPPKKQNAKDGMECPLYPDDHNPMTAMAFPDIVLRQDDCDCGGRSYICCEVCGETYETEEQLERHRVMSAIDDRCSGHDVRCASYQSGEVFQSYRSLRKYCKENDMDVPRKPDTGQQKRAKFPTSKAPISAVFHSPDTYTLEDRRRHSRLNHLKYLPDIVLEDDLISLTESESSSSSSDDGEGKDSGGDGEVANAAEAGAAAAAAPPPDDAAGERRRSSIHDVFPPHDDHHPALKPSESGLLSPQRSSRLARDVDRWRDLPQVEDHLSLAECEIVVIVEAIDTYTSSTMQARHSYSFNDGDVLVNRTFVPCVEKDPQGKCLIDLKKFHETRDCDGSKNSYFSVPSIV